MKKRVHLTVRGCVQGVYFRAFVRDRARHLGLTGYGCNCPDGSVEIVAEGDIRCLEQLVVLCNSGPPDATVQDITAEWQEASGEFPNFAVR
jgi:acylphosphatase